VTKRNDFESQIRLAGLSLSIFFGQLRPQDLSVSLRAHKEVYVVVPKVSTENEERRAPGSKKALNSLEVPPNHADERGRGVHVAPLTGTKLRAVAKRPHREAKFGAAFWRGIVKVVESVRTAPRMILGIFGRQV